MSFLKKHLFAVLTLIIALLSLFVSFYSLSTAKESNTFQLNKFITEIEPTFLITSSGDSLKFSVVQEDVILQDGSIWFPTNISKKIIKWGEFENRLSLKDFTDDFLNYFNKRYLFDTINGYLIVINPFPVIVNYNAIVNGRPCDFRGLYYMYFEIIISENVTKTFKLIKIRKLKSLPIPLKTHTLFLPKAGEFMKLDSIDLSNYINENLTFINDQSRLKRYER